MEEKLYNDAKMRLQEIADQLVIKCPDCDELNPRGMDRINLI
jgi:hypothetical protein